MHPFLSSYTTFAVSAVLACLATAPAVELLANPGLDAGASSWALPAGISSVVDGAALGQAGPVLRISATTAGWHMANQWSLPLTAEAKRLKLAARVKTADITPGTNAWDRPRLMVLFHDTTGAQASDIGVVEIPAGDSWRDIVGTVVVPPGMASASFCIGLHNCTGTLWMTSPSCQPVE